LSAPDDDYEGPTFNDRIDALQRRRPTGCAFIHGDVPGPDWHFCNAPRVALGKPWCTEHQAVCVSYSLTHMPPMRRVRAQGPR
jgi:hypothetical protein